jgi:hypothetical protein
LKKNLPAASRWSDMAEASEADNLLSMAGSNHLICYTKIESIIPAGKPILASFYHVNQGKELLKCLLVKGLAIFVI